MVTLYPKGKVQADDRDFGHFTVRCPASYEAGGFAVDVGDLKGDIVSVLLNAPDPEVAFKIIPLRMVTGSENLLKFRVYGLNCVEVAPTTNLSNVTAVVTFSKSENRLTERK